MADIEKKNRIRQMRESGIPEPMTTTRKRQPWDEVDPETGEALTDIPGIEESIGPDDFIGPPGAKAGVGMAVGALGKAETKGFTQALNSLLRKASPRTQDYILNTKEGQKALAEKGLRAVQEFEDTVVGKVKSLGKELMGAKSEDQAQTGAKLLIQKKYK